MVFTKIIDNPHVNSVFIRWLSMAVLKSALDMVEAKQIIVDLPEHSILKLLIFIGISEYELSCILYETSFLMYLSALPSS